MKQKMKDNGTPFSDNPALYRATIHEVKNKLHFVLNNHEYLEENLSLCSSGISEEFREIIEENRQGLTSALDMLVRSLEGTPGGEEKEALDPETLLEDVLRSLGCRLEGISLEKDTGSWEGRLFGSEEKFKLLLSNLIDNSLKCFEPDRPGEKVISLGIRGGEGDSLIISVADNGPGIPEEYQGKIFDPLFSTRRTSGGTGMGLSIVKDLVEKDFSGGISLRSDPGKGTAFIVQLPLVREEV